MSSTIGQQLFLPLLQSDTEIFDEPLNLQALSNIDAQVLDPQTWRSELETVQTTVFERSLVAELIADSSKTMAVLTIQSSVKRFGAALQNFRLLSLQAYAQGGITCLNASRDGVANLVCISVSQLEYLYSAIQVNPIWSNINPVMEFFSNLGFFQIVTNIKKEKGFQYGVDALTKFVDAAIVSYSVAHVGLFDSLSSVHQEVRLTDMLVLRNRSLGCLKGLVNDRSVLIFEEIAMDGERSSKSLYVSTTPEALSDTWGPIWEIRASGYEDDSIQPTRIRRFSAGDGCIVPWTRQSEEPELLPWERLAHWTQDPSNITEDVYFERDNQPFRLLIGFDSLLVPNQNCNGNPDVFSDYFLDSGRC
jgi:hypothetical protein